MIKSLIQTSVMLCAVALAFHLAWTGATSHVSKWQFLIEMLGLTLCTAFFILDADEIKDSN